MDKDLKRIKLLKITCTIIYSIVTLFLTLVFIAAFSALYGVDHDSEALIAMLMFFVVFPASFIYLISVVLSTWGLSISYRLGRNKDNTYFVTMIFSSIITGILNFFTYIWVLS